jgi:hypothetical protein
MIPSQDRKDVMAAILGAALMFAAGGFFTLRYYREPHLGASVAEGAASNRLNIPTVDQMCERLGATAANMADCRNEENLAGEFVIAWMGLQGFLTNGAIDPAQIQYAGEVAEDATPPDVDPDAQPNIDPSTGQPVDQEFASTAELAMYCLSNSMDWLQLHDCISRYDPSTRFTGQ